MKCLLLSKLDKRPMGYIPHLLRIKWFLILKMRVPFNQECSVPIKKHESPSTKNALYQVKNESPLQPMMLCTEFGSNLPCWL